jgi:hypothetical protein
MRIIALLIFFIVLNMASFGQTITYKIPEGYESEISKNDYKTIVDFAVTIVAKRYSIDYVKDGAIHLKKDQEMQIFNLHNLIAKCVAVEDKSEWNKVVQEHFEKIFVSIDEQKKIDLANFETVKKYLSLRIYHKETINERGGIASLLRPILKAPIPYSCLIYRELSLWFKKRCFHSGS